MHSPDDQLARELNANPEFALFMLDLPIVVQRAFIPLTGRVTAALMLSWAIQVTDEPGVADAEGWFAKGNDEWHADIGLSRDELQTARDCLEQLGLLEVKREATEPGTSAFRRVNHYRVDLKRLSQLLLAHAEKLRQAKGMH
ncbi:MAG: hypothetical protein ACOZE7_04240 [Pseudomonadota bacterium]|uniref:Uncharacterized protein n=1 Tax=Aquabacterium commune TaxID=70586 RepID=A0A4R6RIG6_9BURK|nr:hypothetical protein [Aquabacterium]MBT9610591.1 hypothetical protein [Aquabacterium sp.]TDP85657.1 hypothetical protein EV672_1024 [Aquabacterium commune]|tara:strand:- start:898 stop:1323 length:426 start_codon:yes stop_codon:yes gene_type:complete